MKTAQAHPALRFILPITCENIITILIGLVFSLLIGQISGSALAAIGMCNTIISLLFAVFSLLTTGSAVLTARLCGAGDYAEASRTVEQSKLLSILSSVAITVICLLLAFPLVRLLMPNAEAQLFDETVICFRVVVLSLPGMVLHGVLTSVMRAAGNSRQPMLIAICMNLLQIVFAWLCISVLKLDMIGAGLSYVGCRTAGALLAFFAVLKGSSSFHVDLRAMFKPHLPTCLRILRIGTPTSIESIFVQTGYLIANTMIVGLGTFAASTYQVANTVYSFSGLPQGICAAIGVTLVGQLIGAKEYSQAKKLGWRIWISGMAISLVLAVGAALLGTPLCSLYSTDPKVVSESVRMLWILVLCVIPAISINVVDPQLRAGGDTRFVMIVTVSAVWLLRIPLTYLLAYTYKMGVAGVFLANIISLFVRAIFGMIRYIQGKWMYKKI